MATIQELQREIAIEKRKIGKIKKRTALDIKRDELRLELFRLKNKKLFAKVGKTGEFLKRVGKKAFIAGKKQAKLIRDQELRNVAIERKLSKRKKPRKRRKQQSQGIFDSFNL